MRPSDHLAPFGVDLTIGPSGLDVFGSAELAALLPGTYITFPGTLLDIRLYVAIGQDPNQDPDLLIWTEIPQNYILWRDKIRISRGRKPGQTQASPSTMALSIKNAQGRYTWGTGTAMRLDVNPGTGPARRFTGYVVAANPRSDTSGATRWLAVQAAGILQRLGRQQQPAHSAVWSMIDTVIRSPNPAAFWWPLEDSVGSISGASALTNGPAMVSSATFGTATPPVGIAAAPTMTGATLAGPIVSIAAATGWQVLFHVQCSGPCQPLTWTSTEATVGTCYVDISAGRVKLYVNGVDVTAGGLAVDITDDVWSSIYVIGEHVSPGFNAFGIFVSRANSDTVVSTSATVAGVSVGTFTGTVIANSGASVNMTSMAQIFGGTDATAMDPDNGYRGFPGERATDRFDRMAETEGIPIEWNGDSDNPIRGYRDVNGRREFACGMGPQGPATSLSIFRECEAATDGFLLERLSGRLGLNHHDERENQPVGMTLTVGGTDADVLPPFEPQRDDQQIVNDATIGTARDTEEYGPLGVDGAGRYDSGLSYNIYTGDGDTRTLNRASFEAMRGTRNEPRFDSVTFNLAKSPHLIPAWLAGDPIGMHVQIDGLDETIWLQELHELINGYDEEITQENWQVTAYLTPEAPYRTFTVEGDENLGRLDNPDCTLAADLSDDWTITTIQVNCPTGLWRTGPAGWPLCLAGQPDERIEVVSIAGGSSPQTMTITRHQGKTVPHLAGSAATLWRPGVLALLHRG